MGRRDARQRPGADAPSQQARKPTASEPQRQAWRRVASTHQLQDLESGAGAAAPTGSGCLLGALLMCGAVLTAIFSSAALLPVLASGAALPSSASAVYYTQAAAAWLPATALFVFVNWFCNKLFKHNT